MSGVEWSAQRSVCCYTHCTCTGSLPLVSLPAHKECTQPGLNPTLPNCYAIWFENSETKMTARVPSGFNIYTPRLNTDNQV